MTNVDFIDNVDEGDSTYTKIGGNDIQLVENSNEWTKWRDDLVAEIQSMAVA